MAKGSYLLILHLTADVPHLQIGRLGCFDFAAGYYLYVGSAFGSGGLSARLAYHQRRTKPHPHWHLDYLRPHAHLLEAWTVAGGPALECTWCTILSNLPEVTIPVRGFGSSDTHCASHLFYSATRPRMCLFSAVLLQSLPLDTSECTRVQIEISLFDEKAVC
jgi:Uri superfamily endonuclease